MRELNAVTDDGADGCVIKFTGLFAGDEMRRGFLNVFQYRCSGVRFVEGSEGSFTCWRGRTGTAMMMALTPPGRRICCD